jgi:hypothetical protein
LVVCSAYLPYDFKDPPLTREFEELVRYCEEENLYLVMGCDSNSHHMGWGNTYCNDRGMALLEFLNSSNMEILNQGNDSTYCSAERLQVIEITLGSFGRLESLKGWEVSFEPSLSDHRHIMFTLEDSVPVCLIRNPRGTNWDSFQEGLKGRLESDPEMNMEHGAGLGLAILSVQQALISAYKNKCPLKSAQTGRHSLKWTSELEFLRRGVRQPFNKCQTGKNPRSRELYRQAQRRYRKPVRKASKEAWRTFCSSVNDLLMSAKLHRALLGTLGSS